MTARSTQINSSDRNEQNKTPKMKQHMLRFIRPHMEYAIQAWSLEKVFDYLQKMQRTYLQN